MVRICVESAGMFGMDSFCAHSFAFLWFCIGGFRVVVMCFKNSCLSCLSCKSERVDNKRRWRGQRRNRLANDVLEPSYGFHK